MNESSRMAFLLLNLEHSLNKLKNTKLSVRFSHNIYTALFLLIVKKGRKPKTKKRDSEFPPSSTVHGNHLSIHFSLTTHIIISLIALPTGCEKKRKKERERNYKEA